MRLEEARALKNYFVQATRNEASMTDFERGFNEELAKIAAVSTFGGKEQKGLGVEQPKPAAGVKPLATAMRAPLSMITAMKPPKQEFYKGK
jgi:hypothetical protein